MTGNAPRFLQLHNSPFGEFDDLSGYFALATEPEERDPLTAVEHGLALREKAWRSQAVGSPKGVSL